MKRFYVLRDESIIGATSTREEAIEMIRQKQKREDHYLLRAGFSIMYGEEEFIDYPENELSEPTFGELKQKFPHVPEEMIMNM